MAIVKINNDELKIFSDYIKSITGIYLDSSKGYLLETRLVNMIRDTGSLNYISLYRKIRDDASGRLERQLIDAVTTNETLFFRDRAPFELLEHKILPDLIDRRVPDSDIKKYPLSLKIWSAACSTGQEVYSIGIVLKELLGDITKHRVSILGTDISDDAVTKASYGYFNWVEIERGLPGEKLDKYFTKTDDRWKISDEIRSMANFKKLNLMDDFGHLGMFDIVFCRNVAIYFPEETKKQLFNRISRVLKPDGALIIGSTESIATVCHSFESKRYLRSIYYQLKKSG